MNFLKGIKPSTFLSTYDEWHALVDGFSEVICPWPPRHSINSIDSINSINSEYHYYTFGRALGVIAWLIIAKIIQEVFF
jgi:hypothetical protein